MHEPQVPPSAEMRFVARVRSRWSDEDNQGVLNNAVYLTLFEEARHAYFGRLGLLEGNRFPFLLAQSNVRFLRPGRDGPAGRLPRPAPGSAFTFGGSARGSAASAGTASDGSAAFSALPCTV